MAKKGSERATERLEALEGTYLAYKRLNAFIRWNFCNRTRFCRAMYSRSYGPAVGQRLMECICEITRCEFDREDGRELQAALSKEVCPRSKREDPGGRLHLNDLNDYNATS